MSGFLKNVEEKHCYKAKGWIHRCHYFEKFTTHFNAISQSDYVISPFVSRTVFPSIPFYHAPIFIFLRVSYQPLPIVNEHPMIKNKTVVYYRYKTQIAYRYSTQNLHPFQANVSKCLEFWQFII